MIIIQGPWNLFCKWFSVLSIMLTKTFIYISDAAKTKPQMDVCCHLLYIRHTNKMEVSNVESEVLHYSQGHSEWTEKQPFPFSVILPLTGLKKLKKESCGTSLVMVLTVPLPLCFCFFLIVFTVTSLPFCQSILQLDKNQNKTCHNVSFQHVNIYKGDNQNQQVILPFLHISLCSWRQCV